MKDVEYEWNDVKTKNLLLYLKKDFLKYFVLSVILVTCFVFLDGKIETGKLWAIPISIVVITGCLYIAHICINIILKSFRIK